MTLLSNCRVHFLNSFSARSRIKDFPSLEPSAVVEMYGQGEPEGFQPVDEGSGAVYGDEIGEGGENVQYVRQDASYDPLQGIGTFIKNRLLSGEIFSLNLSLYLSLSS
jgi:hypothetical protein